MRQKLPIEVTLNGYTPEEEAKIRSLADRYNIEILGLLNLVRSVAICSIDPLEVFMLHPMKQNNSLIIHRKPLEVPDPYDPSVDITFGQDDAEDDAKLCAEILQNNPTTQDLINVYLNGYNWAKFWAVRNPNPTARARF